MRLLRLIPLFFFILLPPVAMSQVVHQFTMSDLPDSLTTRAEIVVLAKYRSFRGPCVPARMKGGKMGRRWSLHFGFRVQKVQKGEVNCGVIKINTYQLPQEHSTVYSKPNRNQYYWVLINPTKPTRKVFAEQYPRLNHSVTLAELVAILPAKKE